MPYGRLAFLIAILVCAALLPGAAHAQTFTPELTPSEVTVGAGGAGAMFQAAINHDPGFSATIRVSFAPLPPGISIAPAEQFLVPPYNAVTFTVSATASAANGAHDVMVFFTPAGEPAKLATLRVNVTGGASAPPAFSLSVTPDRFDVPQGQTRSTTVSVRSANAFSGTVSLTAEVNPALFDVTVTPPSVFVPPNGTATAAVSVRAQTGAPQGGAVFVVSGRSGTLQDSVTISPTITAGAPPPDFAFSVTPPPDLAPGQTATVNATVIPANGFAAPVTITVSSPGNAVTAAPVTMNSPFSPAPVALQVAATAQGAIPLTFTATSGTLVRTSLMTVNVSAPPPPPAAGDAPSVQAITPPAYAPMPDQELIVLGRNFAPGATVTVQQPERGAIRVAGTRFISPTQLGVTVSVTADAPAGRGYPVTVRNPNGRTSAETVLLVVAPQGALGGPVAVTRAAIEFPVRGQVLSAGKGSIAAAHLATSGSGTIAGRWKLRNRDIESDAGFVFDHFTATVAGGFLVSTDRPCYDGAGRPRTTAHVCASIPMLQRGTYQLELVVDQPRLVTPASVPITIQSDSATELTIYRPRAGTVETNLTEFSWTTVPGVSHYNVEFIREDGTPEHASPILFETPQSTWRPDLRELRKRSGLTPGAYRWRVIAVYPGDLRGQVSEWRTISFTDVAFTSARLVATVASNELAVAFDQETNAAAAPDPAVPVNTYTIAPNATFTQTQNGNPSARVTVSSQGELGIGSGASKVTADINYNGTADPQRLVQESRNWVVEAGTPAQYGYGLNGRLGYTTPDFTSGAEFLTSGSAQTGIVGHARSRFGTFSYYQPVSTAIHGVLSALPENLEIRSAAFSTPDGRPYSLRLIALEVEEPANEELGVIGSRLRTLGFYGKYDFSPAATVVAELAHGRVHGTDGGDDGRNGAAMRVGLTGARGTFNYSANVRSIGANFVNPANRGLTAGGVSDRLSMDVNVGKTLGMTMLTFGLRRQDQGRSSESTMPKAHQNAASLGLTTVLAGFSVNVSANYSGDRGDANALTFFPATRRDTSGASASFSRMFGLLTLSPTLSYQRTEDGINPLSDQTMTSAGLMANGTFFTNLTVSASVNASRNEAAAQLGTTDSWTMALSPSLAIPSISVSLRPSASISRSENATLLSESKSEQYNLAVAWTPPWFANLIEAEVSSSWSRSESAQFQSPTMRTLQGSLTLKLSKQRNMPWFATGPLPGTVPQQTPGS